MQLPSRMVPAVARFASAYRALDEKPLQTLLRQQDWRTTHSGVRPPRTESTEVLEEPLGPMRASTSPGLQLPLMPNMICSPIYSLASEAPSRLLAFDNSTGGSDKRAVCRVTLVPKVVKVVK